MTISAIIFDTHAEVKISGGDLERFNEELDRFRETISWMDRSYDPDRKSWCVINLEKYREVPYIKMAFETRANQLELF